MRQKLSIERGRATLILIDLQEEQRHDYVVAQFPDVLANACRLLTAARANRVSVVHAAYRRDFDAVPPRPFEPRSSAGGPAFSDKNSPLIAICSEVAPRADEPVLFKNDADAFGDGRLEGMLRQAKSEWLVVAGVWTEACVAATVRGAMERGIRVLLVKDACGSGTVAMHQIGILNLANRLYGGAVTDAASAAALLAGGEADVWVAEKPVPLLYGYGNAEQLYAAL